MHGLAIDTGGIVYIADTFNHKVRKVAKDGSINTVAGTGAATFNGDGPALQAALNGPKGVAVDTAGNLYIADYSNNLVRKVTSDGNSPPSRAMARPARRPMA